MKKKIKIAHLYYDIMNLYGENGNILALEKFITKQGVDVQTDNLSIGDKLNFEEYDLYYLGAGSEENELFVLDDLMKYKKEIVEAVENGKIFLVTGNAMELFGSKIVVPGHDDIPGLALFNYDAVYKSGRQVGEITYEFEELEVFKGRHIIGFRNTNSNIVNNNGVRPFGFQDNARLNNFFTMNFVGPLLIRNPYFTDYLLKILFDHLKLEYKEDDSGREYDAYREYVKNFMESCNLD